MPRSDELFAGSYDGRPQRFGALKALGVVVSLLGLVAGVFVCGEYLQRALVYRAARAGDSALSAFGLLDPLRDIVANARAALPRPLADARLQAGPLRVYDLRIEAPELAILQRTAEQARARGSAGGMVSEYVDASFRYATRWRPVQVKLQGSSLHLKFPARAPFEGREQIDLHRPAESEWLVEATVAQELRSSGGLARESRFVVLRRNAEMLGVFQEMEPLARGLWERSGRVPGLVFSGTGQLLFGRGSDLAQASSALEPLASCAAVAGSAPDERCSFELLRDRLDVDRWAWAAAMKLVLQSAHGWQPDELRLSWDPARGSFEPIAWRETLASLDAEQHPEGEPELSGYAQLLSGSAAFRRERDRRAWQLLDERVGAMVAHANALSAQLQEPLRNDWRYTVPAPDLQRQAEYGRVLTHNRDALRALFEGAQIGVRVWRKTRGRADLEILNSGKPYVSIQGYRVRTAAGRLVERPLVPPRIVDGVWNGRPGRIALHLPLGAEDLVGLVVNNEVTLQRVDDAAIRVEQGSGPVPTYVTPAATALRLEVRGVRVSGSKVAFGPGQVALDETLELPPGYDVVLQPGLDLRLATGVSLIVHGDLSAPGTQNSPVRVSGRDDALDWGALVVQGTRSEPREVRLEHLIVRGGSGARNARTSFRGALSVHDAAVVLLDSQFLDAHSDSGLSFAYADVDLRESLFQDARGNALDCTFCTGTIANSRILRPGGDGLNVRGSSLYVEDNELRGCGSRGIRLGERSQARLARNTIGQGGTGIALEDLSGAQILDTTLADLEVGVALYARQPSFGPSSARVANLRTERVATRFARCSGCPLELLPEMGPQPEPEGDARVQADDGG